MSKQAKVKVADCVGCWKSGIAKRNCPYRNWPFNEAQKKYLDSNGRCSKRKKEDTLFNKKET